MNLNKELLDYEIGGIGDIKKYTLRFHSYYLKARDGEVTMPVALISCYYFHIRLTSLLYGIKIAQTFAYVNTFSYK